MQQVIGLKTVLRSADMISMSWLLVMFLALD